LACSSAFASGPARRTLTFENRVAAQKAIEQVYARHRIGFDPSRVVSDADIRAKVRDYLAKSAELDVVLHRPIDDAHLQAELERMARDTRDGATLNELFDALGRDATLIAETLAREALIDRWFDDVAVRETAYSEQRPAVGAASFSVPPVDAGSCTVDTWVPTRGTPPAGRFAGTAIWTGAEMIVWGGTIWSAKINTGGRYNPATDSWAPTSTGAHVPDARGFHSAVWTGTEMIVWGGEGENGDLSSGSRYNPATDAWTETAALGAPDARAGHVAVWTGREMIVWGGGVELSQGVFGMPITGGRYDPITDSWTSTSTGDNVPQGRMVFSAVWTGTEMIVWGGLGTMPDGGTAVIKDGGRYDPQTDSWAPTSIQPDVPVARKYHEVVWTGSEMVVWGGMDDNYTSFNTGGRYDPRADTWTPTSTGPNVPAARFNFTAVWTGTEMIVWGGSNTGWFNSGGRYDPRLDTWTPTSTAVNDPSTRDSQYAAWTGSRMIIWGGLYNAAFLTSGASYCVGGCAAPSVYYQDRDGDGFGDSSVSVPACQAMLGYVDNASDCDDADPSIHPGATEICNEMDDNCDGLIDNGIAAPSGSPTLSETKSGLSAQLAWSAVSDATAYDVASGSLTSLLSSTGDFTAGTTGCLGNDVAATTVEDPVVPAPGDGLWYLVRAVNSCGGSGSYDEGAPSQAASRDAAINAASATCP
jgi:N-acetylneuraminic acid mutarotase